MLAVTLSPRRSSAALASKASIVPGASYHRVTLVACPGRVLRAEPQVGSRVCGPNSYACSLVSHAPLRTVRARFPRTLLSSDYLRRDVVQRPAWISSWHGRQTTSAFRRRIAMSFIQAGFSFRPGRWRSASLRMWWTWMVPRAPQSSQHPASRRLTTSFWPVLAGDGSAATARLARPLQPRHP